MIDAIKSKKQINIINYHSAQSNNITNRNVEPFQFTTNYVAVWCYEIESKKNKLFKTSRIEQIEVLTKSWFFENQHQAMKTDAFRISSNDDFPIKLILNTRAYQLMIEEYPLTEKSIIKLSSNTYKYNGNVCSFDGIGRFVLGLKDEIEVLESPDFREYLCNKLSKYKI